MLPSCLAAALLFNVSVATADESTTFSIDAAPAWVEPWPIPTGNAVPKGELRDGIYALLDETQVDVARGERYGHVARLIVNAAGVERGSEISVVFDPSHERLTLHAARVVRDGAALDQLDRGRVRVIQREADLERHLYDGRLSAVLFLDDVRAGDVVEYAYTLRGRNPILGGKFVDGVRLGFSVPVEEIRWRLLWPTGRSLHVRDHSTAIEPVVRPLPGGREYLWRAARVPATEVDGDSPAWYDPFPWVQLSEFATWADVGKWALALYGGAELPPALRSRIDAIKNRFERDEDRVLAATRFVQDEVRYLGMEVGVGSQRPASPGVVFDRRFGDCKDKTNLLCAMLSALGVEAHPALINTRARQTLDDWEPSPYAFNHAVVCAALGGRTLWLDPTISHQRGPLDTLYFPPFARSLVLREGTAALTAVAPSAGGAPRERVHEWLEIHEGEGSLDLRVVTMFQGADADGARDFLATESRTALEKGYLDYYAHSFPRIATAAALAVDDDESTDTLTLTEAYRVEEPFTVSADGKSAELWLRADEIRDHLVAPDRVLRRAPLAVTFPRRVDQVIEVTFPTDRSLRSERKTVEDDAFRVTYSSRYQKRRLELAFDYEARCDAVAPTRTAEYVRHVGAARDLLEYGLWRGPSALPAGSPGKSEPLPGPDSARVLGTILGYSLVLGVAIGIAYVFRRLIPTRAARARSARRAEVEFVKGQIHYLDKPHLWARLGRLQLELDEPRAAAEAFRRAAAEADDLDYRFGLAEAEIACGRSEAALTELEAIVSREPDHAFGGAKLLLARTLISLGRHAAARVMLEDLRRSRATAEAGFLLALVLERAGERDAARELIERVEVEWRSMASVHRPGGERWRGEAARLRRRLRRT